MKVVVYTAIFGDKDTLVDPVPQQGIDYVCFTDKPLESSVWQVHTTSSTCFSNPRLNARMVKLLPHRFFPHHDVSFWVDGNVIPKSHMDIRKVVDKKLTNNKIAISAHFNSTIDTKDIFYRNCLYDEAEVCLQYGLDEPLKILNQVNRYLQEGYPVNNGLYDSSRLIRLHNDVEVKSCMETWWEELHQNSCRDQISFPYALHKHSLSVELLHGHVAEDHYCERFDHKTKQQHNDGAEYAHWLEVIRYLLKNGNRRLIQVYSQWISLNYAIPFRKWYDRKISAEVAHYILREVPYLESFYTPIKEIHYG